MYVPNGQTKRILRKFNKIICLILISNISKKCSSSKFIFDFSASVGSKSNPNITNFEQLQLDRSNSELTESETWVRPPKPNFKPFLTPPNSPNVKQVLPETSRTQVQIQKKNFIPFQTQVHLRTMNPPEPSKNSELRIHELGSTQHYSILQTKRYILFFF